MLFSEVLKESNEKDYDSYGDFYSEWRSLLAAMAQSPAQHEQFLADLLELYKNEVNEWRRDALKQEEYNFYKRFPEKYQPKQFLYQHLYIEGFRVEAINLAKEAQQWAEAIKLAKEGAVGKDGHRSDKWHAILEELYGVTGQNTELQAVLKKRVHHSPGNVPLYLKWKATYQGNDDAWAREVGSLIVSLKLQKPSIYEAVPSALIEIYAQEGMQQELFESIEKQPTFNLLNKYQIFLYPFAQKAYLEMYESCIWQYEKICNSRGHYAELAQHLLNLSNMGQKALARSLRDKILVMNNRRPAMKDELGKIGI